MVLRHVNLTGLKKFSFVTSEFLWSKVVDLYLEDCDLSILAESNSLQNTKINLDKVTFSGKIII